MRTSHGTPFELPREELMARLAANRAIGGVPRSELEWLAAHGELRRLAPTELMSAPGTEAKAPYTGPTLGVTPTVRQYPTVGYRWSFD